MEAREDFYVGFNGLVLLLRTALAINWRLNFSVHPLAALDQTKMSSSKTRPKSAAQCNEFPLIKLINQKLILIKTEKIPTRNRKVYDNTINILYIVAV